MASHPKVTIRYPSLFLSSESLELLKTYQRNRPRVIDIAADIRIGFHEDS
jgi:hypothetical protein